MIDLEDGQNDIRGELQGPGLGVETVPDLSDIAVLDLAIVDIDAPVSGFLSTGVHFSDDLLGLETSVLGEGTGDNFKGLSEALEGVLVEAGLLLGELLDLCGQVDLGGTGTGNHTGISDESLDGVDTIIDGAFGVLEERVGRSSQDNGSHLVLVLVTSEDGAPVR